MAIGKYKEWLEPEGLLKLEGWARNGLTDEQIAQNMGITAKTLYEWKKKYSEICGINTIYLSVFSYLSPCFIIECKNEKKKPDNNYMNKLESIMHRSTAQFGIVFGRKDATRTCFDISREHYLLKKGSIKQQIVITCDDKDLNYIIDKRINLLHYLEYKIFQVTNNSPDSTYEMFYNNMVKVKEMINDN